MVEKQVDFLRPTEPDEEGTIDPRLKDRVGKAWHAMFGGPDDETDQNSVLLILADSLNRAWDEHKTAARIQKQEARKASKEKTQRPQKEAKENLAVEPHQSTPKRKIRKKP